MNALKSAKECIDVDVFGSFFFQIEWPLKNKKKKSSDTIFSYLELFTFRDDVRHMKPCYAMLKKSEVKKKQTLFFYG